MPVKKTTKKTKKKVAKKKNPLTTKQENFCLAYVANRFNGVRAAEEAGYSGNYNTLSSVSKENLQKPLIKARIKDLTTDYLQDKKRLGQDVINELYDMGMRRVSDVVKIDDKGRTHIKSFEDMGSAEASINKIKVKQVDLAKDGQVDEETPVISSEIEVWLENKTKPLEILGKYTGLIVDKQELSHNYPGGEFSTTKEYDVSKLTTEEKKTWLELTKKMQNTESEEKK